MPKLLRKIALAWMLLWLPLSGVMASTLPFCGQGLGGLLAMQGAATAEQTRAPADKPADLPPCHTQAMDETVRDPAMNDPTHTGIPGEHCSLCHLAGAIALPGMPVLPQIAGATPLDTPFISDFRSWLDEPLQPPPLFSPA